MFCDPNLKNRDNIEAIKKSVGLPGTYLATRGSADRLVSREGGCLTQASTKRQNFVARSGDTVRAPVSKLWRFIAKQWKCRKYAASPKNSLTGSPRAKWSNARLRRSRNWS